MTKKELTEEINIEFENISEISKQLNFILASGISKELSIIEITAAGSFLAQFYSGFENILKRLSKYYSVSLPKGEMWHFDLFKRFCDPPFESLPLLFDEEFEKKISPYRRFRHIVFHGYSFQLNWDMMKEGIENFDKVKDEFIKIITSHLRPIR